jgi:hypothetical protein
LSETAVAPKSADVRVQASAANPREGMQNAE